ncbi:MAG: methionine gamma-lyase family protein [Clostridiales bacterium]|nr:methionine gamma-lyase family protein [Clostridiales bacterium]
MDIEKLIKECEKKAQPQFERIDAIAYKNQVKVLDAFHAHKIALRHFAPTTGYGYDDVGRDTLSEIFAQIAGAESAIVSPLITSGTHAITLMLFGILRPNDTLLSVTGDVYDTLQDVISGEHIGSLRDFGVTYRKIELQNGKPNQPAIEDAVRKYKPKVVFLQRSRGYSQRDALSIEEIQTTCSYVKAIDPNIIIAVDNCYGEFVSEKEPTEVGADLIAGSMIKNPGGGIAPTGGYIAGKADAVQAVGYRLTAPGVGTEVGSYAADYRPFYQGLFMAPHVTAQALKGSVLFGAVFDALGYETIPKSNAPCNDIIRSVRFNTAEELIAFCRAVQAVSPIDSHVVPYPWDMPGYNNQVIMAAGTFVQGASIELSADSPIKEPYIAYLQGGLTYEHAKYAVLACAKNITKTR